MDYCRAFLLFTGSWALGVLGGGGADNVHFATIIMIVVIIVIITVIILIITTWSSFRFRYSHHEVRASVSLLNLIRV